MSLLDNYSSQSTKNIHRGILLSPEPGLLKKDYTVLNRFELSKKKNKKLSRHLNFSSLNIMSEAEKKVIPKNAIFNITELKKIEIKQRADKMVNKLTDDKENIYKPIKKKKIIKESINPKYYIVTNILMNNTSKNEYKSYNNQLICFGKNEARKDFIDDMRKYYIMQKYQVGKNLFSINRTNCGADLCKSIERVMFPLKKF